MGEIQKNGLFFSPDEVPPEVWEIANKWGYLWMVMRVGLRETVR